MANYYLGSDVSKGYADFVLINQKKKIIESNFQLDDTRVGHQRLEQFLVEFFENNPKATVFAAFESTGGYENNWIHTMQKIGLDLPINVARLNPTGVCHDKQAGLKRNSTDPMSALVIAKYQINHADVIRYNEQDQFKSMKKYYTTYRSLFKIRTKLLNQLESLFYTAHPELVKYRKDKTPLWLLRLVSQYPVADDLANAQIQDLVKIPFITDERAEEIISAAQQSVASAVDYPTQIVIKELIDQVLSFEKAIKKLEKVAKTFINIPEIDLISSIESIGVMSAIGLFIETGGNIDNFPNAKKLSAYWGLPPRLKESGDGSLVPKMSKAGRVMPRAILFMVVLNNIQRDGHIAEIYKRELQKGKCKMSAIGVCMNKMSRIIYGVLKNRTPYNPDIDRHYQHRAKPKATTKKTKNDHRRFQKADPDAPISRKQIKKRKERKQSQSEQVAVSEIKSPPLVALTKISDNQS
jgi:transposase